mgnify:FL=1
MLKKYIGDRAFYKRVFQVAVPIIIQNGITNFVSLLDNIMVGQVGTLPMSGVSIVNQLIFVFNLCIFGASSGAGIFTAQFHGKGDAEGVRHTFRFKFLICTALALAGGMLFFLDGSNLIRLYLTGEGDAADAAAVLGYGREYLRVMLWGLLPFALCNAYASTLKESGETFVPMAAGVAAVAVNLVGNYILIFGHFGAPAMGVRGAALATVISRYAELLLVAGWTHRNAKKHPFIRGAYASMAIPGPLLRNIVVTGMPLLANELLWSLGVVTMNQCYSTCGLDVVPAMNISSTLGNLAGVVYQSLGVSVGILMGQMLGAGHSETDVRDTNRKLIAFSVASGACFGALMALGSGVFPAIYNTTEAVRGLAQDLILISALVMPFQSFANATYFTLRSGGKTMITFLFDSVFLWVCGVSLAFTLSRFTNLPILPLFALCQLPDVLKCVVGEYMLKKGSWIQTLA